MLVGMEGKLTNAKWGGVVRVICWSNRAAALVEYAQAAITNEAIFVVSAVNSTWKCRDFNIETYFLSQYTLRVI